MTPSLPETQILSGSAEKAMATMLGVMMGLKDLYRKETEAVKTRNVDKFLSLQPVKEAYTRDYELLVKELQARSSTIKKMSSPLRDRIIAEQAELAVLAEQSMEWSLRMAESLKRVQERLIQAARESLQQDLPTYGAQGSFEDAGRPVATAFNSAY